MLNLHKCEGDRSVNLFFVLPSSAFWLPGHTIVQFFSMTARPRAAMAWLFGEWRAGSSVLQFSEGLRELPTQMHSCRKRTLTNRAVVLLHVGMVLKCQPGAVVLNRQACDGGAL